VGAKKKTSVGLLLFNPLCSAQSVKNLFKI
jgi:hypothetical protein